jgi:hypothetical protein
MEHRPELLKKKSPRQTGTALLTDKITGRHCYAILNRISCHGMYIETECAFKPGNKIELQFYEPPLKGSSTSYSATVYWCMLLSEDESINKYGIGVKYL